MARKLQPTDGLGPYEVAKIRSAIRQVWQRSRARREALKLRKRPDDYWDCDGCLKRVPKVYVDHIEPVGDVGVGFIERLFCPSHRLQCLCKTCHDAKTNAERRTKRTTAANAAGA